MSEPAGFNYFNYFTEIEDHFQRVRGTSLFLLSPLDWALIESWKQAGVPLEAVLRGIEEAFRKWRSKRSRVQMVNSLAYCAQAVMVEAQRMAANLPARPATDAPPPFDASELEAFLTGNAAQVRRAGLTEIADSLDALASDAARSLENLQELDQRLTALEEKMLGAVVASRSDDEIYEARRELEFQLRPYRSKMTAPQLAMLEKQFLERKLLERSNLPRLSLFYLH